MKKDELVDVIAVSYDDSRVLWVEPRKTERSAEAIIGFAVARQGVDDRYYTTAPTGKYEAGDVLEKE